MVGLPNNKNKDTMEQLYCSVGKYLSHWEALETQLSILFGCLTGGNWRACVAVYSSITGAHNRLVTLGKVTDAFYTNESENKKRITKILSSVRKESKFRNNIAHGQVHKVKKSNKDKGYFLTRASYDTKMWPIDGWPEYYYTTKEIEAARERCDALREELDKQILNGILQPQRQKLKPELRGVPQQN